jgi:hypothetical protein
VRLGVGVALVALVIVFGLGVARGAAVDHVQGADARDAAGAVWDAFLADLSTAALILAGMGAVVAAAAASLIRPADIRAPLRRAGAWVITKPALLVVAGVLCVLEPAAVVRLAVSATGLFLIYAGLSTILWRINEPRAARPAAPPARRRRGLVAGGIAIALIAVATGTFAATGGTTTAAPRPVACNGHAELCDRPLNAVALAATHNSMSAPLPGWFSTQQDASIADQLHDGIHGLLIDTHYADRLPNGRLRTDLDARRLRSQAQADGVSPQAVDAALRIRERLGFAGKGTRGMYLCHSFCELGGTPLHSVLQDLDDFLVANPGEVVVVINQDYVSPEDFVGAVRQADLERFVYRGPTSGRWPSLRQMIDSNERLVVLAENKAGAAPWYHLAYDAITQETPFSFRRPAKLTEPSQIPASCGPNRGPSGAPMFLVNHWITTDPAPKPSNARIVNAYNALLDRLETCRRIRHHIPNLVAVDFYRQGDVLKAVDALNGVG